MTTLSGIITPSNVETASSASTLTNKTINGSNNTITNVSLSTGVTGTLPVANGGTGTTSTQFANLTSNVTGTLPVANGGTGVAALTANNVLLGNGTSAVQVVAPGPSGNVLQSNGSTWASAAPVSSSAMTLIQTQNGAGASFVEFTGMTAYNNYRVVISSYIASLATLEMRWGHSGGYYSISNFTGSGIVLGSSSIGQNYNLATWRYILSSAQNSSSQYGTSGYIDFFDTQTSGKYVKSISNVGFYFNTGPAWTFEQNWIVCATTLGFDRVRFLPSTGTFTSGIFSLYGILQ